VIETPEDRRIKVFRRGTWVALNGVIPKGGHVKPIYSVGESLLWKNAQKNEKKNKISEVMKRIIPHRSPLITTCVWSPWKVLSRVTSRHHIYEINNKEDRPSRNKLWLFNENHFDRPVATIKVAKDAKRGQGLWSIRW